MHQSQAVVLELAQNMEDTRVSNAIDLGTIIQFRTDKY